jgi:hypothetical protein
MNEQMIRRAFKDYTDHYRITLSVNTGNTYIKEGEHQ